MQRLQGRPQDTADSSLMTHVMSNGLYHDPDPATHHMAAENLITAMEGSGLHQHTDVPSYESQAVQQLLPQGLHVQSHASRDPSLSSDTAQNTHLPMLGAPERTSIGEDSVSDFGQAKPEESMDDILRFFLKVSKRIKMYQLHCRLEGCLGCVRYTVERWFA